MVETQQNRTDLKENEEQVKETLSKQLEHLKIPEL
jgi:hypothetical protein